MVQSPFKPGTGGGTIVHSQPLAEIEFMRPPARSRSQRGPSRLRNGRRWFVSKRPAGASTRQHPPTAADRKTGQPTPACHEEQTPRGPTQPGSRSGHLSDRAVARVCTEFGLLHERPVPDPVSGSVPDSVSDSGSRPPGFVIASRLFCRSSATWRIVSRNSLSVSIRC